MSQQVHINLDGGRLPLNIIRPNDTLVATDETLIEIGLMEGGTAQGNYTVGVFARALGGNQVVAIELTANNFLQIGAAIRGRLIRRGFINVSLNPAIGMLADREKGIVHFVADAPLQEWDYDVRQAKNFWRVLRQQCEHASK